MILVTSFQTQKIVRRNVFKNKPMTEQIVGYINNLSTTSETRELEINNLSKSIGVSNIDDEQK